jgi:hypothetical protein
MRRVLLCGAAAALATLAACSPGAPTQDKAYYAAHPDERMRQLTVCQNDPGRLASTTTCVNAQAAEADAHAARFYAAPKPAPRVADPGKL